MKYLLIILLIAGCLGVPKFPPPSRPDKLMCEMRIGKNILCRTYCIKGIDGSKTELIEILRNFNGRIVKTEAKKEICTYCNDDGKDYDCYMNNPYKEK